MKALFGVDDGISDWVSKELYGVHGRYQNAAAIGFIEGNELLAGVVYHNYHTGIDGLPLSIEMSIATTDKRWCTKANLRTIFSYPFIQLGLKRVQILTSVHNEKINSLVSRLGYVKEGLHREAHPDRGDAFSWSMLKQECRWL